MKPTLRRLAVAWPLTISFLVPALTRGETAVQAWVQRYNGPGNENEFAEAVAVDGSNNVIVTGHSRGSGSLYDYVTIKYSNAGVPLWTNRYNGPGNDFDIPRAMAVDGNNDVVVTGASNGSGSGYDYATIKYSSAGVPLWTNRYVGPGSIMSNKDEAHALAVDGKNDVIVTGNSYDNPLNPQADYLTIKYSSVGVPLWTNRYDGPAHSFDQAYALATDGNGDVIVTGLSTGVSWDYATIKYSSEGMPLWTNRYNGPGNSEDSALAITVDGDNNVIVTGRSTGSGSGYDYATIMYSSAGVPLWTNRYNGLWNDVDVPDRLAVDRSGNVIVKGCSRNSGGPWEHVTIKYSHAGVPLWTNHFNGPPGVPWNSKSAMAVDGSNNVVVTGTSFAGGSTNDYVTIKYSSAGALLWSVRYNGPGNGDDETEALAVDRSGNVIVTGYSIGSGGNYDLATIRYICVPEPVITNLHRANGTSQMRVENVLRPGTLVIEASSKLSGWAPIFTNTTPTSVLFYTDPQAGSLPARYYRAYQFP